MNTIHVPPALKDSPVQQKIYRVMKEEEREMKRSEIAENTDIEPDSVSQALRGLMSRDLVQKTGHGWYKVRPRVSNSSQESLTYDQNDAVIPLLSVAAEAGNSNFSWETRIRDYMRVNRSIISTETGADPDDLAVIPVSGDSMLPAIKPGDRVVIVRHRGGAIIEGAVYVWRSSRRGIVLKRVHWRDEETLELVSDNDRYDPITLDWNGQEAWQCLGQVVQKRQAV